MIPQSSSSSSSSSLGSNFLNPAPIEHQNSAPSLSTTRRNKKNDKKNSPGCIISKKLNPSARPFEMSSKESGGTKQPMTQPQQARQSFMRHVQISYV